MTIAKLNYQRKLAGLPLIRFDLTKLQPEDVQDLRDAYAAMYEISDQAIGDGRGYTAYARGHGYDQQLCHNDNQIFLTWHRAYIYAFEKALNAALRWKRGDGELELTLPFWDWTAFNTTTHAANGLPKTVNAATYRNADGDTVDNPLAKARSIYRTDALGLTGDDAYTNRDPSALRAEIPILKDDVDRLLTNPSFRSFSEDLDRGAHGAVHVRVGGNGGDMGRVISAGFDPVFWLHHSMVDKVWFDWQTRHPGTSIPQHVLDTPVYGGRPGRDYIDAENDLKYIYSTDSVTSAVPAVETATVDNEGVAVDTSTAKKKNKPIDAGEIGNTFERAQLDFHRLRPPTESLEVRAYVGNAKADAKTGYQHASYIGRIVFFGHGECYGAPGHCNPDYAGRDEYDQRPKHALRYKHTKYTMDVTRGLRRYLKGKKKSKAVKIYLVTVDGDGKAIAPGSLEYEGCTLRTLG